MIEFQYDEKTYVKMSIRIGWWAYAIILGIVLVGFACFDVKIIADYLNGERNLTNTMISIGLCLVFFAIFVGVFFVSIRKQLSKNFAMYSSNGVVIQRAEITDEELIINNVSRQSVTKTNRRDIVSVKKYKSFFVVTTNTKTKWAVPFNNKTQLLYDVLTRKASISDLPTQSKKHETENEIVSVEDKHFEQQDILSQANALSFEYELSEQQAINMLTKVISVRYRAVLGSLIVCSIFAVIFVVAMIVDYLTSNALTSSLVIFTVVFAVLTVLLSIIYANKNKGGRVSGSNYFHQQAKDGVCLQRIELYDQGIVVINKLRDTKVYFRLSDMEKVSLFNDFFFVEFKSKEVLPVPLTDDTRRLYDILNNGIKRK